MAQEDSAIVVGISSYPGFTNLNGSENDALAMYDWLLSPAGGDIPQDNIDLIITAQFNPPFRTPAEAKPTGVRIQEAFEKLQDLASVNLDKGDGLRIGRRLWVYLAGHGFGPDANENALLAANATRIRSGSYYHVLGVYNANYVHFAGYFDEVLLFMDCCRERVILPSPNMPYGPLVSSAAAKTGQRFYAFATKWTLASRERLMENGKVHGVFTSLLLDGLRGAAVDPGGGDITTQSLNNYLKNEDIWRHYLEPADWNNDQVPHKAEVVNPDDDFLIASVPPPLYAVTLHLPPELTRRHADVLRGQDLSVVAHCDSTPAKWQIQLGRGTYQAEILADPIQRKPFTVLGTGGVDVQF